MSTTNTNTNTALDIKPTLGDLFASLVAVVASVANFTGNSNAGQEGLEQLGSQIVGRIAASYFSLTDDLQNDDLGIKESDIYVGVVRAVYSMSQKRNSTRSMMDGVRGIVYSLIGQQVHTNILNKKNKTAAA